jgi:DNA-binding MarR family transcriptional regulator
MKEKSTTRTDRSDLASSSGKAHTVVLDAQLCFPLYAASRLLTRQYQPLLERFGLTYPQYVVLMVLWEQAPRTVGEIGERALLNSNTLTPLLKRLEAQGLIRRQRAVSDERVVEVHLTERGELLQAECACVQHALREQMAIAPEKLGALKAGLDEFLEHLRRLENIPSEPAIFCAK